MRARERRRDPAVQHRRGDRAMTETGLEMEACLDAAAEAAGVAPRRWRETRGPDSRVGLDWWFVHRDHPTLFVRVNLDQEVWSWAAQDEQDPAFEAAGEIEPIENDEGQDTDEEE